MRSRRPALHAPAFVNQVVVYALVAMCCCGTIGLGTVWMRHQISIVANANKALASRLGDVQRRIEETNAEVAAEQDPGVLDRRNVQWKLGLVPPTDAQTRRIAEDPVMHLASLHNRTLFGEAPPTVSVSVAFGR